MNRVRSGSVPGPPMPLCRMRPRLGTLVVAVAVCSAACRVVGHRTAPQLVRESAVLKRAALQLGNVQHAGASQQHARCCRRTLQLRHPRRHGRRWQPFCTPPTCTTRTCSTAGLSWCWPADSRTAIRRSPPGFRASTTGNCGDQRRGHPCGRPVPDSRAVTDWQNHDLNMDIDQLANDGLDVGGPLDATARRKVHADIKQFQCGLCQRRARRRPRSPPGK